MSTASLGWGAWPQTHKQCEVLGANSESLVPMQSGLHLNCCRYQRLVFKHNMYKLREERNIKPSTFAELVSSTLYERR